MNISQSTQGKFEFIQGSSLAGIAQWRQAVKRQEIGAWRCEFLQDSVRRLYIVLRAL